MIRRERECKGERVCNRDILYEKRLYETNYLAFKYFIFPIIYFLIFIFPSYFMFPRTRLRCRRFKTDLPSRSLSYPMSSTLLHTVSPVYFICRVLLLLVVIFIDFIFCNHYDFHSLSHSSLLIIHISLLSNINSLFTFFFNSV